MMDNSVDVVLCFETLEHVTDPVLALREIRRICRKKALVSIPWVEDSRVLPVGQSAAGRNHIFEYSPEDFPKVAAVAGFEVSYYEKLTVLGSDTSLRKRAYLNRFYLKPRGGYFPSFQFYELVPS